jgi:hypothetical protein
VSLFLIVLSGKRQWHRTSKTTEISSLFPKNAFKNNGDIVYVIGYIGVLHFKKCPERTVDPYMGATWFRRGFRDVFGACRGGQQTTLIPDDEN